MARDAKAFIVDETKWPGAPGAIRLIKQPGGKVSGFNHACPCGCGNWSFMALDAELTARGEIWSVVSGSFDDLDHLTLTPSIGIRPKDEGGRYHWHGFLENGVFVER